MRFANKTLAAIYLAAMYAFLMAPLLVVVGTSFNSATSFPSPFEHFTLSWYSAIADQPDFLAAAKTSALVAAISAALAVATSFLAGYWLSRFESKRKSVVSAALLTPMLVPQIVLSLAVLQFAEWTGIGTNLLALIAVHTVYVMPFALRLILTGLASFDFGLEEASRNLGAGWLATWREVTLPLLRPSIVAAFTFSFILSFVNLPISMFLTSPETATLPTVMFAYIESRIDPMIAAVSTAIIAIAAVTTVILERWLGIRLLD
ncbi:ABC transporter permease [Neorhizobium sp. P12A]|uniref:ABC transporter permease n=1 Tax=Neorhizobium sp. P12A TaxID=2268027 RepID=UPI0011EFA6C9|nr:ABC transporter permease [Neorhizobium sp. P12A]KAA0693679.1 ABC transporter permease [Neorhizobium sp. P12A]